MICRFCGTKNPDEVNFCGNCGKPLKETPVSYRPKKRRNGVRIVMIVLFLLTLATYLSYLIFEADSLSLQQSPEYEKASKSLKEKIGFLKNSSSKGRTIDFYLTFSPEEIDGYLNEEFFKKNTTAFNAIRTRLVDKEIELALSTYFLHIPTVFKLRIRPEKNEGKLTLSTSGISLGRLPFPPCFYPFLYRRYPWFNVEYLLKISGVRLEEIRIEKSQIFLKGIWSI